ncbi:uncharacterized protein MAM_00592 [Metarhizium album ARSEF 1941]|uniref:Uncharacterized protein n=1 Tax=Metarhizium album (strain ARSEF 1941) TaxID=1081103 RepID=A0A0B2X8F1_METAS|nr:uncharacterized protein MAM_00592 [Metarhizium album ARSEF 1941]KHO01591.1 hypothetical protein MAM_00592 [Metarhizium album ARSEF 1941]
MYASRPTSSGPGPIRGIAADEQVFPGSEVSTMQMSRPYSSYDMYNPGQYYEHHNIIRVLIPISVAGWILFGAICILCINGHGRAGRWVPEWYLDSEGTRWDKAAVGAWWLVVLFGWPVILPGVVVGRLSRKLKRLRAERTSKTLKTVRDRESEGEV